MSQTGQLLDPWKKELQEIRLLDRNARGKIYKTLPAQFFRDVLTHYGTILTVSHATTISESIFRKYLKRHQIEYDTSFRRSNDRDVHAAIERLKRHVHKITSKRPVPRLPGKEKWAVTTCWHCPTVNPLEIERLVAVCHDKKVRNLIVTGDFGNYDALSFFAEAKRGKMPRLQTEINTMREALGIIRMQFTGRRVFMLTNHEYRLLGKLHHELDGEDFFERLLGDGEWIDKRLVDIGSIRICHKHGRKVLSSAPNELSLRYEMPVYAGGAHRFFAGHSQSGQPIGHLGGLFDKERMGYYMDEPNYLEWETGFFIYENSGMTPFSDVVNTDWGKYGVK